MTASDGAPAATETAKTAPRSRADRTTAPKPMFGERTLLPMGEMAILLGQVLWSAVRHPRGYWGSVRDVMFDALKLCWIPLTISTVAFGFGAPGLQGGNIYLLFGIPERLG